MRRAEAERATFEEYVTARRPALVRTAYLLCGDAHLAEDLVQGALIKAVAHWRRIGDNPEPWLRRVMVNDHISGWRKHRGRERLTDTMPERVVEEGRDLGLAEALRLLPPRQRAVVVLRYYEDLTERETADVLGIALGTVKSQHADAVRRLRELVPSIVGEVESTRAVLS
ncbi:SigE family RNA polymerase sigma factor [Nocardioides marmorisolisilvae]|uniref:SigE family RNA polymerase sigma factor n=1 Tax=Nocardioides marmorisolisilvae TaxID=1542737 RepID=A0A3N0DVZ9_9ACTN|nr:SigE family RNA polymerase sigma factor [Nocardioides marmorisolisilvae]RNL79593.1 SigE family RNA polymerase sigma factor [Nocardioides marmorisolisilvae]